MFVTVSPVPSNHEYRDSAAACMSDAEARCLRTVDVHMNADWLRTTDMLPSPTPLLLLLLLLLLLILFLLLLILLLLLLFLLLQVCLGIHHPSAASS